MVGDGLSTDSVWARRPVGSQPGTSSDAPSMTGLVPETPFDTGRPASGAGSGTRTASMVRQSRWGPSPLLSSTTTWFP